ncbi:hypothetical protein SAMN04487866_1041, partial [Thermoactinomyces sp. DSM 45891]|uniref:hypothetical protein n=1 Tax=Thermoactinomyces sp. DSM 45891 TaxID=1761907 RepID=UPI0009110EF9
FIAQSYLNAAATGFTLAATGPVPWNVQGNSKGTNITHVVGATFIGIAAGAYYISGGLNGSGNMNVQLLRDGALIPAGVMQAQVNDDGLSVGAFTTGPAQISMINVTAITNCRANIQILQLDQ